MRPKLRPHLPPQCPQHLGACRSLGKEALRETHGAERQGRNLIDHAVDAQHQLERAAANVGNHRAAIPELEVGEGAPKAESRLFFAIEHAHAKSCRSIDTSKELL